MCDHYQAASPPREAPRTPGGWTRHVGPAYRTHRVPASASLLIEWDGVFHLGGDHQGPHEYRDSESVIHAANRF